MHAKVRREPGAPWEKNAFVATASSERVRSRPASSSTASTARAADRETCAAAGLVPTVYSLAALGSGRPSFPARVSTG